MQKIKTPLSEGGEQMKYDELTYWKYACAIVKYLDVLVIRVAQLLTTN